MHKKPSVRLVAYILAVLAPALTLLALWPLPAALGDQVLYTGFFPAVLIAAYLGGLGPGLLATVISALAATFFLVEPLYSFAIHSGSDAVALAVFLLVGVIISGLGESLQLARRRIVTVERQRAEEALRETEERFRGTFEHAAVGIAHVDAESRCLRANAKMCEILGYTGAELVGKTVPEVTHPDDLGPNFFWFGALMRGELANFTME
ncbi:MAG TPA: DUF4118 domain-containing protein, partial [Isosphaeraceae bacterium]|nr:DUF4118 domain-containing protein [Isosphaeraceae bacterium]